MADGCNPTGHFCCTIPNYFRSHPVPSHGRHSPDGRPPLLRTTFRPLQCLHFTSPSGGTPSTPSGLEALMREVTKLRWLVMP